MSNLWWRDLKKLDPTQGKILGLAAAGRYYITGPAGSGKTNLLVLRARRLAKLNVANYVVLVYNGPLEKFVSSNEKYGVDPTKVRTVVSWMRKQLWDIVGKAGVEDLPDDIEESRKEACSRLYAHLIATGKRELIDTILVDEVQDYTPQEIRVFGLMAKNLFLVGDVRQQIYNSEVLTAAIDEVVPKQNQHELTRHYRIGRAICLLADRIAKPSKGHKLIIDGCCYDESKAESSVTYHQADLETQIQMVADSVTHQLDAYPEEFIGVMCPRNDTLDEVARELMRRFPERVTVQQRGDYKPFLSTNPIVCSTLHNGKGLEYRCVHIVGTDRLRGMPHNRELIYTGVTRAQTSLAIYYNEPLLDFLADALAAGDPPPPTPSDESLFG